MLAFFTAFLLVMIAMPSLIKVAKLKHLVDEPGEERKLHSRSIPTLGGIMIFAGTIFAYSLLFPSKDSWMMGNNYDPLSALNEFKYLIASMFILFFLGLKDDIIGVAPVKKLYVHALVGFTSMTFGFWFYSTGDLPLSLLALSLAGALAGFLFFNFQPAKIFMGDAGSLILGMIMYVLAMKLIEFPPNRMIGIATHVSKPVLAMAILSYPLADTLRVFIVRIAAGKSPFLADKNHVHHKLLSFGWSHRKVSFVLYLFTLFFIILTFIMPNNTPNISLTVVCGLAIFLSFAVFWIPSKK